MLKLEELESLQHVRKINFDKLRRKNFRGVSIDSRKVRASEIFIAIKGENTDGHRYIKDVITRVNAPAVVSEAWYRKHGREFRGGIFITVDDTVKALGELAKIHKDRFGIPVLCIAGSNGKTTTKDLIADVLSKKYKVLKTEGNFNNHIGLPLTLLRMNRSHGFCVLEAGCNHFGELEYLCGIAEPDFGMVTNIGKEHLEFFRDLNGVAKAEFELYEYLRKKKNGILFVNLDDPFIKKYSEKIKDEKKFSYSYKRDADVTGRFKGYGKTYQPEIEVRHAGRKFTIRIATFGKHSVHNGLAAAAGGIYFKVSPKQIGSALKNFTQKSPKRMEIEKANGMTIINDTYNSNPESVRMGLETLMEFRTGGKKYAVLSDMLELGKSSENEHLRIGKFAADLGVENLFTYGKLSYRTFSGAKKIMDNFHFENKEDLISVLRKKLRAGDVVYVKGSRGMKMEEVVNAITKR